MILKISHNSLKGLTLFELAISIAIFVIAACGILSLFISLSTLTESAGNVSIMSNLARGEMEGSVMVADFETLNSYALLPPAVPANTSLTCYVQDHPTINNVKQALVVVSYRQKSSRVIGEDRNLNGILDAGEDTNGDGRLSSLCELATFVIRKE